VDVRVYCGDAACGSFDGDADGGADVDEPLV
jgi:hypothetical protein